MSLKPIVELVEVAPEPITISDIADLEPITIGEITEITGASPGGSGDANVLWGS